MSGSCGFNGHGMGGAEHGNAGSVGWFISERVLSFADIYMLSQSDIRIAKNEIYARHGRKFASEDLQLYFSEMEWYHGTIEPDAFDPSVFNEI